MTHSDGMLKLAAAYIRWRESDDTCPNRDCEICNDLKAELDEAYHAVTSKDGTGGLVADIRFPDDQGPFGFPLASPKQPFTLVEHGWSDSTFTTEITCEICKAMTRTTAQRVRASGDKVFIPATCQHCHVSGEIGMDRAEFERRFPDAKL